MPINTPTSLTISDPARKALSPLAAVLTGFGLGYVVLQGGLTLLTSRVDQTINSLMASAAMLAVLLAVEAWLFRRGPRQALRALGLGRPTRGALLAALLLSAVLVGFIPLYGGVTGTAIQLRPDWAWVLLGAVVLNGLAEETLFRGFAFGHLRQAGCSFRRAGLLSLGLFAAAHLYLFVYNPAPVALLATLTAVTAAFPFALLFERGNNTVWACALLHTAAHAFRLVAVPEAQYLSFALAWMAAALVMPLAIFVFRRTWLRAGEG